MKNIIGLIILVIIGVGAYFLLNEDHSFSKSNTEDYKDFSIEDTAAVSKIFLSQPSGKSILLTRVNESEWIVNNSFGARKDGIDLILKTLSDIKVSGLVAQDQLEHTIKSLATRSTKVEFYTSGNKPKKTWYIGDPTVNRLGTHMLLEKEGRKSSKPYITHMIMERGYLGTRFFMDPILWKDRVVMKCNPKEIKSVEVIHAYDTALSFKIEQYALGKFNVTNLNANNTTELSPQVSVTYLKEFAAVYYEYIDQRTEANIIDSIYSALPRHSVKVSMNDGKEYVIKSYNMPVKEGSTLEGKEVNYHPERMYIYTNHLGADVYPVVQNLTFDKLVPSLQYLASSTTVEK